MREDVGHICLPWLHNGICVGHTNDITEAWESSTEVDNIYLESMYFAPGAYIG